MASLLSVTPSGPPSSHPKVIPEGRPGFALFIARVGTPQYKTPVPSCACDKQDSITTLPQSSGPPLLQAASRQEPAPETRSHPLARVSCRAGRRAPTGRPRQAPSQWIQQPAPLFHSDPSISPDRPHPPNTPAASRFGVWACAASCLEFPPSPGLPRLRPPTHLSVNTQFV